VRDNADVARLLERLHPFREWCRLCRYAHVP
jgi:hypothetical protein